MGRVYVPDSGHRDMRNKRGTALWDQDVQAVLWTARNDMDVYSGSSKEKVMQLREDGDKDIAVDHIMECQFVKAVYNMSLRNKSGVRDMPGVKNRLVDVHNQPRYNMNVTDRYINMNLKEVNAPSSFPIGCPHESAPHVRLPSLKGSGWTARYEKGTLNGDTLKDVLDTATVDGSIFEGNTTSLLISPERAPATVRNICTAMRHAGKHTWTSCAPPQVIVLRGHRGGDDQRSGEARCYASLVEATSCLVL